MPQDAARARASRRPVRWLRFWPEAAGVALGRAAEAALSSLRRGWVYRLTLQGPVPDRIVFQPPDPRPKQLDDADGFLRNRFRFAGQTLDAQHSSVFDCPPPSAAFAGALHGFEWLRHLEAAGGDNARKLALKLASDWLARHGYYGKPAWYPEIAAARLMNVCAHGRFFLANSDLLWRSRFFVSLRNQARLLARTIGEAPDGLPRLHAAAALALAGLCLSDARNAALGLARLAREIDRQILPDGGHVSRSPEALLEAFRVLVMVQQALDASHGAPQAGLRGALDRMAPMLRFFRLGDGALAVFNGGSESDARMVTALLASDEAQGRPFGHAPHSAFQRLAAGNTVIVQDVGVPPSGAFSVEAHAGCLAFEMSTGAHRLMVNCGAAAGQDNTWTRALRGSAAHTTLTFADTPSASLIPSGWLQRLLGPRLVAPHGSVETRRSETAEGILVESGHDLYAARFGMLHRRRLMLSANGTTLTGADRLIPIHNRPRRGRGLPFAIRFHVHPDVRLSLAQGGGSVILKLPSGEGWRFRCGGPLEIEESVYLGGGTLRRTEQLVIAGHVRDEEVECAWLLEQLGAG